MSARTISTMRGASVQGDCTMLVLAGLSLVVSIGYVSEGSEAPSSTRRVFLNSYIATGLSAEEWGEVVVTVNKLLETT